MKKEIYKFYKGLKMKKWTMSAITIKSIIEKNKQSSHKYKKLQIYNLL